MHFDKNFINRFNHHFKKIDKELSKTFDSRVPMIKDIGNHTLLGEGKRLRPLLFVLSSKLCGYGGDNLYHISTLFEYIHTASLLHDDVIDDAAVRRSKPSAKHIWGNTAAVLAGDYLSAKAASVAADTNVMEIVKVAMETGARMTEGQFLELLYTGNWKISKDEYMTVIVSKTAELISASCSCGAIIAEAGPEAVENLRKFGLNLGIAFQLVDDLLDYALSEEEFGKPVGKDLIEGKTTLPLIYSLPKLEEKELERLEGLFKTQRASEEDHRWVIEFVRNSGAIEKIRAEAMEYADKAAECLAVFPESPGRQDLIDLNQYMINRNF